LIDEHCKINGYDKDGNKTKEKPKEGKIDDVIGFF
jgi:hypothetical protein